MSISGDRARPIAALLVATWYPGVDDPGRGRFVADQADALLGTGFVRPLVLSFDVAYVHSAADAARAHAITDHLAKALESRTDAISPRGWSTSGGIGVARLPAPDPYGRAELAPGQEAEQRRQALELLADRLDTDGMRGVVHAHTAYPDGYAAAGIARRLGWPLIITEHASFVARQLRQPEHRLRYMEAIGAASRFIAVSDMLASELVAAIPELGEKLEVVPNAIALDAFETGGMEGRVPDELIFVGNRKERKGMVVLLRAFADVLEERPSATLRLIGKSVTFEEESRWMRLAEDLGIAQAVRFEGPGDRAAVARALRRASLFVHPSPRETFGVVTLEALASGLPVVSARSGGISSILEDERLGTLVPAQDPRMLARAVIRTLQRRDEFRPEVLRAAVEPFSASKVAGRLAALYHEVLEQHERAPATAPGGVRAVGERTIRWGGTAEPIGERLLVVAQDTDRAARVLVNMPPDLLARITLVTHGETLSDNLPGGIGRVVETRSEVGGQLRRIGLAGPRSRLRQRISRLLRNPIGAIVRRTARGGLGELRWKANATALERALAGLPTDARNPQEILCLDSIDYAVASAHIMSRSLPSAPGGLLWLADRWAAAQETGKPSRVGAGERVAEGVGGP